MTGFIDLHIDFSLIIGLLGNLSLILRNLAAI